MGYRPSEGPCYRLLDCVTPFCRFWGLATAIGMYGVGADVMFHKNYLGMYIIVVAFLVTFLETTWVVSLFLELCISDENSSCLRCWEYFLWLDRWKKSALYICLALFMFTEPHAAWMALISGSMMLVLALLYLIATYKAKAENKDSLLGFREETYDRFDDDHEELDDTFSATHLTEDTVGTQDEILEV